jgi:2-haloacid dehalogenase
VSAFAGVRALAFDVFGTVVDWREGVAREAARVLGPDIHARALADWWRAGYQPAMEVVRSGARPWVNLDVLNREILDLLLPDLPEDKARDLSLAWHRLDPWPDVIAGMERLRRRFILAPVSNGHIALIVDMSRRASLRWDAVLGAEVSQGYKPQAQVYDAAARLLGLEPHEVMMVAAHPMDLQAAAARGLHTAYVHRPNEFGAGVDRPRPAAEHFDVQVDSFLELADRFAC